MAHGTKERACNRLTNKRTNRHTERPSYKTARRMLKTWEGIKDLINISNNKHLNIAQLCSNGNQVNDPKKN